MNPFPWATPVKWSNPYSVHQASRPIPASPPAYKHYSTIITDENESQIQLQMKITSAFYILWFHSNVFTEFLHPFWSNHIITPWNTHTTHSSYLITYSNLSNLLLSIHSKRTQLKEGQNAVKLTISWPYFTLITIFLMTTTFIKYVESVKFWTPRAKTWIIWLVNINYKLGPVPAYS